MRARWRGLRPWLAALACTALASVAAAQTTAPPDAPVAAAPTSSPASSPAAASGPSAMVQASSAPPRAQPVPLEVTQVADGVFVHFGAIEDWLPSNGGDVANIGFVVGTRCVAVIDTGGTPAVGERLRAAVERQTRLPVCYVIDTHAHPDHVLGNAAFARPGTDFVASAHFAHALSAREPYFRNALQRDFGIEVTHAGFIYPTVAVDGRRELDLGGRTLELRSWPTAHTDNDLTVLDTRTRTLFLSDLLFVRHMPVIDGSLRGWLKVMDELRGLTVTVAVPGHGPSSTDWPAALEAQRAYLDAVLRETRAAIRSRMTLAQAVDRVAQPAAAPWLLADRFHRRNVTAAYAELEWEE